MKLNEVNSGIHKHKKVRRIGRGPGSGRGKTSTRGGKGPAGAGGLQNAADLPGRYDALCPARAEAGIPQSFCAADWCRERQRSGKCVRCRRGGQSGDVAAKGSVEASLRRTEDSGQGGVDEEPEGFGAPF